jgi:hypothetical protein
MADPVHELSRNDRTRIAMRPFNTDEHWAAVEQLVRAGPLPTAIEMLAGVLRLGGYQFADKQAQVAADMLARSTRDPAPERGRLVGNWQSSDSKGVPGLGRYSWDIQEYRFQPDFTYTQNYSGVSGIRTPSFLPVQVSVNPTRTSSALSGVYMVGIQDDRWCALCLCPANSDSAIVRRFYFFHDRQLYMDGQTFKKMW